MLSSSWSKTPFFFYLERGNTQDLQTIRSVVGCSKAPTPRWAPKAHHVANKTQEGHCARSCGTNVHVLDRFHLIIPEIGILSSGNQVSEFLLLLNHLYQACSGPGLREVPVDTFQLSGSRKICISFAETFGTWKIKWQNRKLKEHLPWGWS